MSGFKSIWRRYRVPIIILGLLVVSGLAYGGARYSRPAPTIPTATVQRGDFLETVKFHGRIIAAKSVLIKAPAIAGDIQITFLARTGTAAKVGDIIAKFDTSKLEDTLNQRRSDMKQAEAGIGEERAKARLQDEQDRTDLLTAQYDVKRAQLDASQDRFSPPSTARRKSWRSPTPSRSSTKSRRGRKPTRPARRPPSTARFRIATRRKPMSSARSGTSPP